MDLPFIDVVIPTFNRAEMLERMIGSLMAQAYPANCYRVIVVNDGSTDQTWPALEKMSAGDDRVRALRATHRGSYAARNLGWRAGSGEIVAFTDDDCLADSGWLAAIARGFAVHPDALGLQGKTVTIPELVTPFTHQVVVSRLSRHYETCNMAYRRDILAAVGGFDEEVAYYAGDTQMGAAVSALGPIIFYPEMIVIHPPRPRTFLGREEWTRRLEEILRLYCRYPAFYRRTRGPHFLVAEMARWGFGSTIKNAVVHLPWLVRDPGLYLKFLALLLRERAIVVALLPRFWRERRGAIKKSRGGRG